MVAGALGAGAHDLLKTLVVPSGDWRSTSSEDMVAVSKRDALTLESASMEMAAFLAPMLTLG